MQSDISHILYENAILEATIRYIWYLQLYRKYSLVALNSTKAYDFPLPENIEFFH